MEIIRNFNNCSCIKYAKNKASYNKSPAGGRGEANPMEKPASIMLFI
ncbi:hypothetical protein DCCM_3608 [Desulfocucumis palustris]|uniref:Uncharacterized protein n=1 Tax=Desulfocucumis palustris TaxID=1898651 RepID=A0A2L2XEA1_9FIRM|nr:hypothetical protein DCCM_3608 [Desulfocucumis palustris]